MTLNNVQKDENRLAAIAIGAALSVHKALGPGLLESVYSRCLLRELQDAGLKVEQEKQLPVSYKNEVLEFGYRLDIWVENKLIIEVKAVEQLKEIHFAQTMTYLRLTKNKLGLVINFNTPLLKDGIRRVVNNL